MFKIQYKIVISDYDYEEAIKGKDGFIKFSSNKHSYGEIYPEEIEQHMIHDSIYYWFYYLLEGIRELKDRDYLLISDIESHNTWIEFKNKNGNVFISIIHAGKIHGTKAVEFKPMPNIEYLDWKDEEISYQQLKQEVFDKAQEYFCQLLKLNVDKSDYPCLVNFKLLLDKLSF